MSSAADLQATFMRSNAADDIESSLKYVVVQQAPAIPFSLAVRAGWIGGRSAMWSTGRRSSRRRIVLAADWNPRGDFRDPTYVTTRGAPVSGTTRSRSSNTRFNVPVGAA